MRITSILNNAILLAAGVSSRPHAIRDIQATLDAFEITDLVLSDDNVGNTTVTFNVYDPDPLANETAPCTATWQHNSTGYPQGQYRRCGNSTFAWRLDSFMSIQNLTIGLDHSFVDPAVGDPPYDHISNFGRAKINDTLISCEGIGGRTTCRQMDDIIYANIYATIA